MFRSTTSSTRMAGKWQVYDVVVEGISFINNYRQQFNSILTNEPFDNLLARMREKSAL
jgi:phospholipid transport system substrate-binding protein